MELREQAKAVQLLLDWVTTDLTNVDQVLALKRETLKFVKPCVIDDLDVAVVAWGPQSGKRR